MFEMFDLSGLGNPLVIIALVFAVVSFAGLIAAKSIAKKIVAKKYPGLREKADAEFDAVLNTPEQAQDNANAKEELEKAAANLDGGKSAKQQYDEAVLNRTMIFKFAAFGLAVVAVILALIALK